jgi:hypothetical protein
LAVGQGFGRRHTARFPGLCPLADIVYLEWRDVFQI